MITLFGFERIILFFANGSCVLMDEVEGVGFGENVLLNLFCDITFSLFYMEDQGRWGPCYVTRLSLIFNSLETVMN